MNKELVFLIEDDDDYLELYKEVLSNDFQCLSFKNASKAMEALKHHTPKTIVLDQNLPDKSGIDFCRTLLETDAIKFESDVIFVSGDVSSEVKLAAYDVGAADFITKPFELKELHYKVKSSVARKTKEASFKKEIAATEQLVHSTMAQASQYSLVMSFFKKLNQSQTVEQLIQVFFETMSQFELKCSIKVMLPKVRFFQVNRVEVSPIEKDVYQLLADKGRIYQFSQRLILNDEHVSFIIKNPPKSEEKLGQLRDYAAVIVEGLESKLLELFSRTGINTAIRELSDNIDELRMGINEQNLIINTVMSNMMAEIASSYHSLEMTEIQEAFLTSLVEKSTSELSQAEQHLVAIMGGLECVRKNMLVVQQAVRNDNSTELSDDIELF